MAWKDLKLSVKLGIGFGIVLLFLTGMGVWSIFSVSEIVANAEEVIAGNRLRGEATQREVDHLNWAHEVSALLTDESVHELHVE
ncbi:MAG: chemotaxis protein, partial [Spirochaetia bacterium]